MRTSAALVAALGLVLAGCAPGTVQPDEAQPAAPAASAAATGPGGETDASSSVSAEILYRLLVAEFAGRRGNFPLAVENYLEVARQTRDPAVAERAVRIAVFARDQEHGLEAARLWTEVAGHSPEARQVYAALLVRAGNTAGAVTQLQALVETAGADPGTILRRIGDLLGRERDRERSIEVMREIARRYPGEAAAQFAYARLLVRAERFDEATAALARVRAIEPASESAAILSAQVLQRQERTEEALAVLAGLLSTHPDLRSTRVAYARLLVDAKRYDDARKQFERLVEDDPDNADVRYALALLLLQTKRLDEAEPHFTRLVETGARRDASWFYIGQIAESRGDRAAALEAYARVDGGDRALDARVRGSLLLAEDDRLPEARALLRGYRARSPSEAVRVHRAEAELLVRRERYAEAMAIYDAALEEFPHNDDLLYARAMVAEKMDRVDVLERDLRDILARDPDNADALNALGYTLADRTDRLDEALALIKRALELKPDDYYVIDSMGWVLYRMGRNQEALEHLRRAMEMNGDPEIAAHLGEVLWATGAHDEARKIWETALRTTPDHKTLREVIKRFSE